MPVPSDPYDFVNGTIADGDQVDERFRRLYNALNPAVQGLDTSNMAIKVVHAPSAAQALQMKFLTDSPTIGSGGILNGATVSGSAFTTACVYAVASVVWYSDAGRTTFGDVGGAWISYRANGAGCVFDAYNPNGYYLYPTCRVLALGY
jgi:hypothetical protein